MRSAFESWPGGSPRSSSAGDGSSYAGYEDDDSTTKRVRVVGFPESPNFKLQPNELSRFASCTLDERPKRQSSLAQQLALEAFEQEQKPKLRAINTKAKALNIRTRRASTPPASVGAAGGNGHGHHHNSVQSDGQQSDNNRISFEFPSTLPSGRGGALLNQLNRGNLSGSEAVAIPQGLTKAFTAPQPLPELSELSPSLVAILEGASSGGGGLKPTTTTTPTRGGGGAAHKSTSASRLLPSPVSNQHSPPAPLPPHSSSSSTAIATAALYNFTSHTAAERGALAQVAGLREALRQQQEEVARLQLELAKLAMHQQASRQQRSNSADVQMTPVTPDAADEHQGGGGGGLGLGSRNDHDHTHHHEKIVSMSPDEYSHFEGFAATVTAAPPAAQQWHHHYDTTGGRAW